jgi:hypothetical protein
MKQYLKRTWKNKLVALFLLFISFVPIWVDRDATILAVMLITIVPLFFTSENYIEFGGTT